MMKNIIKYLFLTWFLVPFYVFSQDKTSSLIDSTYIEKRNFSEERIIEFKADPDFDYGTRPAPELSLWERFKMWLAYLFRQLFYFGTETPWGKVLFYGAIIAVLIYAVLKLIKVESHSLFYGEKKNTTESHFVFNENIYEINFEDKLKQAKNNKNYKEAVRLTFLFALKKLTDQGFIGWEPGKTNHEYINELKKTELKPALEELSFYFDYAYYGNFTVTENIFNKVQKAFHDISKMMNIKDVK